MNVYWKLLKGSYAKLIVLLLCSLIVGIYMLVSHENVSQWVIMGCGFLWILEGCGHGVEILYKYLKSKQP